MEFCVAVFSVGVMITKILHPTSKIKHPLAAADDGDDFELIAVGEAMGDMLFAGDQFHVDFHRDMLSLQVELGEQFGERGAVGNCVRPTVDDNLHSADLLGAVRRWFAVLCGEVERLLLPDFTARTVG